MEKFTRKVAERLEIGTSVARRTLQGMTFANRLKAIVRATIEKDITLHTLRHSIATHLLQQDVPLESIKTFLGHSSLESTQIYAHLLKTIDNDL